MGEVGRGVESVEVWERGCWLAVRGIDEGLSVRNAKAWFGWGLMVVACLFGTAPVSAASADAVSVRAVPRNDAVKPGDQVVIAVELTHEDGYHTWPAANVALPADVDEFAIRTQIAVVGPEVWLTEPSRIQWPATKVYELPDLFGGDGTMRVPLYSGKATAFVVLTAPESPGKYTLELRVGYQACDDASCLPPQNETLRVQLSVDSAATVSEPSEPALFGSFDQSLLNAAVQTPTTPTDPSASQSAGPVPGLPVPPTPSAPAPIGGGSFFGFNIGSGLLVLALFAVIGGFLLNLTPCVLPVIPIKVMTLTSHAASPGKALVLGCYMAAGVVAFWAAIGIPMAFISANLDPSKFIFGVWWVTLSIGLIIAVMGLGIMGLFNLNLPQAVYMIDAKADSPGGSFLFGVLTAVLGLPCFGFVAGGLLAGAATLPPLTIMAIFGGIGVGMAAPYLVLSAKPSLLRFIPKTGPASELVKQVMGLLLLAAAAFFLAAGIKAAIIDRPYLVGSIAWWAVGFFVAIAGIWMIVRVFQISKAPWARAFFPVLAVVMVAGIGIFANDKLAGDYRNFQAQKAAVSSAIPGQVPTGVWLKYTPELFAAVRKSGKSVLLDFTADWCINCKVFKNLILEKDPTYSRLASSPIVLLEVDCTSTNAPGWQMLRELGRTGIPTWVIYGPENDIPVVLDLTKPTHDTVLEGLQRAGVPLPDPATSTAAR